MKTLARLLSVILIIICCFRTGAQIRKDSISWSSKKLGSCKLYWTGTDGPILPFLEQYLALGEKSITGFFGTPFAKSFNVYIFPSRDLLDRQWQHDWGDSSFKSECWMVASGVADRLDILSPLSWKTDACEHRATDSAETKMLITHEMVHVFHGQCNPRPTFDGMDSLAWLVEGVATYVSGQLTESRSARVAALVRDGKAPASLSMIWTGNEKYGLAGSLMRYIDKYYGREKLMGLLKFTDQQSALQYLGTTEATLLSSWQKSVLRP